MTRKVFGPASEKQRLVLQDQTTDVLLVGGGAGGGKSMICLMKNLDAIHDQHFRCTILRRTAPELLRQGGLVDESKKIYAEFGAIYKTQAKRWDFPSGAQVSFAAIASDDDLGGWQGKLPR